MCLSLLKNENDLSYKQTGVDAEFWSGGGGQLSDSNPLTNQVLNKKIII
jgi:hypothetical protein